MKKVCVMLALLIIFSMPGVSLATGQDVYDTRAGFIKSILTAADIDVEGISESSFIDVTDPQYIPYIETAYKNGIVSGYGDRFNPEGNITKEQAVIIIINTFGDKAVLDEMNQDDMDRSLNFSDNANISPWAKPYIAYALNTGLVIKDGDTFNPQTLVTKEQAAGLISTAKGVYLRLTREGLSAPDMLALANEKNTQFSTYKQKGTMLSDMKFIVEGIPQEEIEKDEELKALSDEGMDVSMTIGMEMHIQNPDKIYIKQTIFQSTGEVEEIDMETETFMDGFTMYTRMPGFDKWVMMDMSSAMEITQSLYGNEPYQIAQISCNELGFFKEFARYEDDVLIDGKEYYVISVYIDKDTFRKYYMEMTEKVVDSLVTSQMESTEFGEDFPFDKEGYKQLMIQLISGMEIEQSVKYYICKDTKNIEKMWISQGMAMAMDNFLSQIGKALGEDMEGMPDISFKVLTHSEGNFELYDFNVELDLPVITDEDIIDMSPSIFTPVQSDNPHQN